MKLCRTKKRAWAWRRIGSFMALLLLFVRAYPQSMAGLTGVRDTSYTTASAFARDVVGHPQIKMVEEFSFPSVREERNITYAALGKRELKLDIFKNTGEGNLGIGVIIVHGGGWRSGDRSQHYPLAQKLANLGYICFTPEYRLSTEALFPAAVYDLKAAVRWVRSHAGEYGLDPEKIAVCGFSAGGELAAFLGTTGNMPLFEGVTGETRYKSHVNAVIDIDGTLSFVHPESGEGDDSKGTSAATYWFGYPKKENPTLWEAASPLGYGGPNTPPTLFINSSVDRMHGGRDDYIRILDRYGIYSKVAVFGKAPHSFILYHPWFDPSVKVMDDFLKRVFTTR
ncbi:alpha/beta hydrolase [Pseudozobellia thermophila]|uniref:Acetyl esterase/lipase n=1 Tax=Pseudozobellia thermophila TaxID=192903 RepID=A0A1M6CCE2_9FLAO|nr:alpha/beta hydrolase [Pseudozobellia thermophila]SHI58715.1 Acetyl esterase/lipase [Pseudozobellia thermophila]